MHEDASPHFRGLNPRNRKIVEHVARFRIATLESIQKVVLPTLSRNAINKLTNRLCKRGFLAKHTLLHPIKYFVLGEVASRILGLGLNRSMPLGSQALPQEFALLSFATLGTNRHLRLSPLEVQARWNWLPSNLTFAPHCLDQHGVMELVRVDLGGKADHVARKCAEDLSKRYHLREFLDLIAARQFRFVVITSTSDKVNAIQRSLNRHSLPNGLLTHFCVVPQLISIGVNSNHA